MRFCRSHQLRYNVYVSEALTIHFFANYFCSKNFAALFQLISWPRGNMDKEVPVQDDDAQLASMGHRPELKRQFSTW